jgi:pyrimidine deaminase RibD-like protein
VKHEHFLRAVELSKECKPEPDKEGEPFPKVGVVIVKNGKKISEAYRGQVGVGEHAEYIALEKKAGGNPAVQGADLITTLEPCTTRSHDKRPCVSWIKSRNIRKVWIATLDYNPAITGRGELFLREEGILVGRFPDDLVTIVLKENKKFFEVIKKKQPQIGIEEQKKERDIIIENLKEALRTQYQQRDLIVQKYLTRGQSKKENREWKRGLNTLDSRITNLLDALDFAIAVEMNTAGSWVHLGDRLLIARRNGSALLAYRVATEIDATSKWAWEGLVQTEPKLSE